MDKSEFVQVADAVDEAIESIGTEYDRLPVLNREPRTMPEENGPVWAALMARDGDKCWMCGRDGH